MNPLEQIRALLVEDNPADARLVHEFARDCRHIELSVEHVDRLSKAVELIPGNSFEVILLDLGLPDSTGVETLTRLHNAAPQVPIIVMTGNDSDSLAINTARTGAQDYLVKGSFDAPLLERSIRYCVNRWKAMVARKDAEEKLLYEAFHDGLTGLPNRAHLLEQIGQAIARQENQPETTFGLISLKIDRFRMINDSFGYQAGDQVLKTLGQRLVVTAGVGGTVARIGGAQFGILLNGENAVEEETVAIANRFQTELSRPINVERSDVFTPISMGISTSNDALSRADDYMRSAEIAMHRARTLGGARCEVFGTEMREHVAGRLRLDREIRLGMERHEFHWHYQPIVCLRSGRVLGFEALMRWQHPERGLVPPCEFIGHIEENCLFGPLFRHLLPQVLAQLASWQERHAGPKLFVNVNVSRGQIADPDLLLTIDDALTQHPCAPYSLGLELTEDGVMGDSALAVLKELKKRRLRLILDDFGTSYSSLSRLQRFPIDELKIDRSFVSGLPSNPESTAITHAIVTLAHVLGMSVTAEGIESPEQLKVIQQLRCEHAQGYLFSRPLLPVQITTMSYEELCSRQSQDAGRKRGQILLVDDDPANRKLMEIQLRDEGFEVQTVASGQQCLHAVIGQRPDVILLDIQMPGLDGISTCQRLKDNAETADLPVLFITGHRDDDPTVIEALSAGGNDFLSKDAPNPVLVARVESQVAISRANARLRELAITDELTGLHSRRFLFDALRRAIKATARRRRGDEGLACLMIDIDHFKRVNDFHGHAAGDELLRRVGQTLQNAIRETDRVARFGGEEFVVILPDTDVQGASIVADRIWRSIPDCCGGITVSIGLAHMPANRIELGQANTDDSTTDTVQVALNEILQQADAAMYVAKAQGRNRISIHQAAGDLQKVSSTTAG
ncbi:MAG: diguanylate cyclase [Deltaproteobacteria bacterium]|nr:diguanylate cyclase [Deltaproteobacteria bacterium]